MEITVVPSYPAPTWLDLQQALKTLEGTCSEFQVDIVDGQFVPARSWPFNAGAQVDSLFNLKTFGLDFDLEVDCMVSEPEQYLDLFIEVGFKRVVIHYGSTANLPAIIDKLHKKNVLVGLAFTNDVSLDEILLTSDTIDYFQVMGIKEVGKQGQSFDGRTLQTVQTLRQQFPNIDIAVDGSVNERTIEALKAAGANRLAPGSAIVKSDDPVAAYKHLLHLASY